MFAFIRSLPAALEPRKLTYENHINLESGVDIASYSQHEEDVHIRKLIDPAAAKYAVDVGANDGQSWSNSYGFGLEGFHLLLVEPMPVYAERCRQLYAGNDKILVEEAAISTAEDEATFYVNEDVQSDELAMRSSLSRDAVPSNSVSGITVRTLPLNKLLRMHDWPRRYAFLSVDAEGFDLDVLETADLDEFRPSVICVEEGDNHPAIEQFLSSKGYKFEMTLGPNGLYTG